MKNKELNFYFGTKGCPSKYDSMNFNELLKNIFRADYFEEDMRGYLQALQNKFSRQLAVPTIRLIEKNMYYIGLCCSRNTKKRIQNIHIKINPYSDLAEIIFTIPHEVKHSEQMYNLHKFLNFNVIPKGNLAKAVLLSDILQQLSSKYQKSLEHYSQIAELDAYIFAINQMHLLMEKYPLYGNFDFNLMLRDELFFIFFNLRYNHDGTNNPEIKKSMNSLKIGIKSALNGEFGDSCKVAVRKILDSGFDIEKAYNSITSWLDRYSAWILLENYKFNKLGAERINLTINGELNYAPKDTHVSYEQVIDDETINPFSEYAEYIKKCARTDNGEHEKLIDSFREEMCNSI